jgi:oxygen-dependent protoporphyrinogen oxidase
LNRSIAVVGAGIAGLTAAYEVSRHPDVQLTLFEASDRLGGTVETVHAEGFTIECGPDSWVSERTAARELAEELGLAEQLIHSNDAVRRNYLVQGRALTPMPEGMRMIVPTRWLPILESPLFSWAARLAYLREPKRAEELKRWAAERPADADESVRSFVERHFGVEATETIAGPLLAGVFGGDIDTLSAGAVLAPFVRLEREHGSLIAPMMARTLAEKQAKGSPHPLFTTLRAGLGVLVERMAERIPAASIRRQTRIVSLHKEQAGWSVTTAGRESALFDDVLLATPAHGTRDLLLPLDAEAAALLPSEATSAVVVALCFDRVASERMRVPRGFGFLVPPAKGISDEPELLAGTFMEQKFPHRAPPGCVFLRGFFGGAAALRMMAWEDAEIVEAARARFSRLLGPLPAAAVTLVRRWPLSLPQYAVGHPQRMEKLARQVALMPGLRLIGNAYHGVGIPVLIEHARRAAREAVTQGRT